jgi:histone H3/H4
MVLTYHVLEEWAPALLRDTDFIALHRGVSRAKASSDVSEELADASLTFMADVDEDSFRWADHVVEDWLRRVQDAPASR